MMPQNSVISFLYIISVRAAHESWLLYSKLLNWETERINCPSPSYNRHYLLVFQILILMFCPLFLCYAYVRLGHSDFVGALSKQATVFLVYFMTFYMFQCLELTFVVIYISLCPEPAVSSVSTCGGVARRD